MNKEQRAKIIQYQLDEAVWLDSVVRPLIPRWAVRYKSWIGTGRQNIIKRVQHFLMDYLIVVAWLGIKITRNEDRTQMSGKGFRGGGVRVDQIRTSVKQRGKLIEEKAFKVGILIK